MNYDEELVIKLGRQVKDGDITWKQAGEIYSEQVGIQVVGENIRNKYRRLEDNYNPEQTDVRKNIETETHNQDGTVDICKEFYFDPNEKKTPNNILTLFGYSPDCWELVSWTIGKWEVAIKEEEQNRVCTTIRAKIKPKLKKDLTEEEYIKIAKEVFRKEIKPRHFVKSKTIGGLDRDRLMLIPQIEAHLGKVSECIDTGYVYNKEIVIERVEKVFDTAVRTQENVNCDKCLVVIGGDFFNSESDRQTTSGTPQVNDVGFKSMFNIGLDLYTRGLMLLREYFNDIDVILTAGNHSRAMEFFLYMSLSCYFKDDKKVHFRENYKDTQSYVFGETSLFFNHGDANQKRLIGSIPAEFYKEFGQTKNRYLFLGHLHKLEQINSENGLIVHRVPAICEDDSWHYTNRFGIGSIPCHELLIFDKNNGMLSSNFVYFNDIDKNNKKSM